MSNESLLNRLSQLEQEVARRRRETRLAMVVAIIAAPTVLFADVVTYTHSFSNGMPTNADHVNQNFTDVKTQVDQHAGRLTTLEATGGGGGACPTGMARVAGDYCIHTTSPYARGLTWQEGLDQCHNDGFRMCSQTEILNAMRSGVLEQPVWPNNTWYVNGSQAEDTPGGSGDNPTCDVQGNPDEPNHPQYSVQCNHPKSTTDVWRTMVCCSG